MEDYNCPSYSDCQLINGELIVPDIVDKKHYTSNYCLNGKKHWSACKRYITKSALHFCPDFVLPDTPLTPEEIIEKFDNETFY